MTILKDTERTYWGMVRSLFRRMRALYAGRRAALIDALKSSPIEVDAPQTGMHLIGWLPDGISDTEVAQRAAAENIRAIPLSAFALEARIRSGLLLGYASVDAHEMQRGVLALIRAVGL